MGGQHGEPARTAGGWPGGTGHLDSFAADRARRTAGADRWLAALLGTEPGVALVAVGGYGRRELLPGSDLDVLLLHDGRPGIAALADQVWYPIWDSGTRLDHAVRRPADAREVARQDVRVALGLLHARHVAGDPALTSDLRAGALADWRAAAGTRLAELRELHEERAARSGELACLLEPDLKGARAAGARRAGSHLGRAARPARGDRPGRRPAGPPRAGRGGAGPGAGRRPSAVVPPGRRRAHHRLLAGPVAAPGPAQPVRPPAPPPADRSPPGFSPY